MNHSYPSPSCPARPQSWLLLLWLLLLTAPIFAQPSGTVFQGPITITQGGTYSGNWESQDSLKPAVFINTDQPVVIENSIIRARGNLVYSNKWGCNITIRNTQGYGLTPTARRRRHGRFLEADHFSNIRLEHNYLEHTSGIQLTTYYGDHSANQTIKVLYNKAKNIDGRFRSSADNYIRSDGKLIAGEYAQLIQFNNVRDLAGVEIAWNEVINEANNSYVEDNINLYGSSGTAASSFQVHNNYIQGSYPLPATRQDHTGGGIMLAEGTSVAVSAYVKCYDNQVVGTTHYGIGWGGGHDLEAYNNTVISRSVLPDGSYPMAANVGMVFLNEGASVPYGQPGYGQPTARYYNNSAHHNVVGYVNRNKGWKLLDGTPAHYNSNFDFQGLPNQGVGLQNTQYENRELPNGITEDMEKAEFTSWQEKLRTRGYVVGPIPIAPPLLSNGTYRLVARHSGKVLEVPGGSSVEGIPVEQFSYTGGGNQHWKVTATGNGYYKLLASHNNKALHVSGASTANSAKILQYTDNGSSAQRWKIEATNGGYYRLVAECSGKVLEVPGASTTNGIQLEQFTDYGHSNQQWKLEPVTSTPPTNLVLNPGFELDNMDTQTPRNWLTWGGTDGSGVDADKAEAYGGSHSGSYHGTHAKSSAAYEVYTYQVIQNLPNGLYTLRAWVKCGGGQEYKQMMVKHYGGVDRVAVIPQTYNGAWALVELPDINVTAGKCEVAFYSKAAANQWLYFDDVEFFQQSTAVTTTSSASLATTSAEVTASSQLELYPNPAQDQVTVRSSFAQAQEVEVTILTAQGKKASSSRHQVPAGASHFSVPTRSLPAGMYLLQVQDGKRRQTQRLVVTH